MVGLFFELEFVFFACWVTESQKKFRKRLGRDRRVIVADSGHPKRLQTRLQQWSKLRRLKRKAIVELGFVCERRHIRTANCVFFFFPC